MPKIVIREFDKTKAVGPEYSNFAVVVPGIAKPNANCFDENGVYECNSREEFEKEVGLHKAFVISRAAQAPTLEPDKGWPKSLTRAEFDTLITKGNLYVAEVSTKDIGPLRDGNYEYKLAYADSADSEYKFIPATENGEATTVAEEGEETGEEETELTLFAVITTVGREAIPGNHYGNQIAWELLGLGYTVLYKKFDIIEDLEKAEWWSPLKDKSLYDFRYLLSGLLGNSDLINGCLKDVAAFDPENTAFDKVDPLSVGRGDCIALIDIAPSVYSDSSVTNQGAALQAILSHAKETIPTSKYVAAFAPTVTYALVDNKTDFGDNTTFPGSFHYLACAARSSENFSEWYANAGYIRGISKYTVDSVGYKFGEAAVNLLQRRASDPDHNITMSINPIIMLNGNCYLWGNRTTHALETDLKASHFLNIRQLCSTIKKQVYKVCRRATFNPNSEKLWIDFCNALRPMLEKMKADQGITDYKIIKVKNNRKAFLSAILRIVPVEAVEDFDISVYLEDSLSGDISVAVEE